MESRETPEKSQIQGAGGSADLVDSIVARICSVTRARTLEHALEVGEIISQGVYEGRSARAHEGADAHPLYKSIAGHRDLPFGAKRLWTCLKLYELVQAFPGLRTTRLGVAHLRAVVNLPRDAQERLLIRAELGSWTSDQLEQEASAFRRPSPIQGRPPTMAFVRGIQRIERLATEVEETLAPRVAGRLSGAHLLVARENLARARRRLDSLETELERLVKSA